MAAALGFGGSGTSVPRRRSAVPPALAGVLGAARRRLLGRILLQAALWAALANFALILAVEGLNRFFHRGLYAPLLAVPIFAAVAARAFWSVRPERSAAELDRAAGLKDRLATALDLAARPEADPEMRAAQLAETAARVRGISLPRAIRIPPLLWSGPILLAGLLLFSAYVNFASRSSAPLYLVSVPGIRARRAPPPGEAPDGAPGPAGAPPEGAHTAGPPQAVPRSDSGKEAAAPPPEDAAPRPPAPVAGPIPEGAPRAEQGPSGKREGGDPGAHRTVEEPARLFSEPVGAALTPVAPRPASGGGGPGERAPAPRGRVSFSLIPLRALEREGGAEGRGSGAGEDRKVAITVDFDAVPPEHRELVRRYFEALREPRGAVVP